MCIYIYYFGPAHLARLLQELLRVVGHSVPLVVDVRLVLKEEGYYDITSYIIV